MMFEFLVLVLDFIVVGIIDWNRIIVLVNVVEVFFSWLLKYGFCSLFYVFDFYSSL